MCISKNMYKNKYLQKNANSFLSTVNNKKSTQASICSNVIKLTKNVYAMTKEKYKYTVG